jgi:hypothetical protein
MGTGEGTGTDRHWPARHGGGYPPGWQVRYRGRRRLAVPAYDLIGTIAGPGLRDEHTGITWVPVRPRTATTGTPPALVRAQDILDARPPGEPDFGTAVADDDEAREVVVELPRRGPDGHPVR